MQSIKQQSDRDQNCIEILLTSEKKEKQRTLARLRLKAFRERQKAKQSSISTAESFPRQQPKTRADVMKLKQRRENNRISQQKRRENMTSQKKRREREKARAYYHKKKALKQATLMEKEKKKLHEIKELSSLPGSQTQGARRAAAYRFTQQGKSPGFLKKIIASFRSICKKHPKELLDQGFSYVSPRKRLKASNNNTQTSPIKLKQTFNLLAKSRSKVVLQSKKIFSAAATQVLSKYRSMDSTSLLSKDLYRHKQNELKKKIEDFYEEKAVYLPGQRSVNTNSQPKKVLDRPVAELHREMVREQPHIKVSRSTFFRFRPRHILPMDAAPLIQCVYEICLNPMKKMNILNMYLSQKITDRLDLINSTLCDFDGDFPSKACIFRKCSDCGVKVLQQKITSSLDDSHPDWRSIQVQWQRWEKNKSYSRISLMKKSGSLPDLVSELLTELGDLARHSFVHMWQSRQYRNLCQKVPSGYVVMTMDFAENYRCEQQDQPQSAYYNYAQVTIHPVVMFYPCPKCNAPVSDSIVYLSNILKHNAHFVNHVTMNAITQLQSTLAFSTVVIFSDGCSGQYKSKTPFYYMSAMNASATPSVHRCYFGSQHRKSYCDPLGGLIKTAAMRAIKGRRTVIKDAEDLLEFCQDKMQLPVSHSDGCHHTKRSFHLVNRCDLQNQPEVMDLKTLAGTRKIHSIRPLADNILATRNLARFCGECMNNNYAECINKDFVESWVNIKLVPKLKKISHKKPANDMTAEINNHVEE